MTDNYLGDLNTPCPHGSSVVTCGPCLNEYVTAEELLEGEGA